MFLLEVDYKMITFEGKVSLTKYFLFVFIFSWVIWIPLVFSHMNIEPFNILENISPLIRLFGVFGPAIIAYILCKKAGKSETSTLIKRLKIWKVSWKWWMIVVLLQPFLLILTALIYNAFGDKKLNFNGAIDIFGVIFYVIMLFLASSGEEIGWRGVALPKLQTKYNALLSSIILAIIWFIWHIPFWMLQDIYSTLGIGYWVLNFIFFLPTTVLITWFFNNTQGSILLSIVFHLCFNIVNVTIVEVTSLIVPYEILIVFEWLVLILILIFYDYKTLKYRLLIGKNSKTS